MGGIESRWNKFLYKQDFDPYPTSYSKNVILSIFLRDFRMNRLILLLATMTAVSTAQMICGIADLIPANPSETNITGSVSFVQKVENGPVRIHGTITGLPQGQHGFHIHKKGDVRESCMAAGPHFNPLNKSHGGPEDPERHVGDLGNIKANEQGVATIDFMDSVISLRGPHGILGRSIVVHADKDDLGWGHSEESRTTGNSGKRIACGTIVVLEM
ncbi:superoxide dismutase [Cu-Zn] [Augochlora pura]